MRQTAGLARRRLTCGLWLLLAAFVLAAGCARRYRITLNSGNIIDTRTKPRLDPTKTFYTFKDAAGQEQTLPVIRIREIAPK
jgi:hypothetical protein